jgi:acetylornithine deacetylase/succinyl-diaminopimelate desuccinylase-like protein
MVGVASDLGSFLEGSHERRMASYLEFVRIPSVSALPEHAGDCRLAAEWLARDLTAIGAEHVVVSETGGHPVVYGDWLHADGAPTVIAYGHYDVQPPDPLDLWDSPPFEPVLRGNRLIARGAEDNKACVQMHVRAAEALLRTRGRLPVNLRFVFEGEEESGSTHLDAWLEANRDRLGADVAVISDTDFFEGNRPAICLGVRGLLYAQIDVTGPSRDLHSGAYGGAVENPIHGLAVVLASLKGPDGRILIPGFYDEVVDIDPAERASISALPFDEDAYRLSLGVPALAGERGYTTVERKTARPTLDVNGIWGGFSGEGAKTIIPAEAHAKLSCRLVPDQRPTEIFRTLEEHVRRVAPSGVEVAIRMLGSGAASITPIDHPATRAAARAIEATFGVAPLFYRAGGSVPVTASFSDLLGLPVVLLGFAPPDSQAHSPNEWMDLDNFETGIRTIARCWDELGTLRPDQLATKQAESLSGDRGAESPRPE